MPLKSSLASTLVSLTLVAGANGATAQPSAAGRLSKAEAAAIAGIGGSILGAAIANANRGCDGNLHYCQL